MTGRMTNVEVQEAFNPYDAGKDAETLQYNMAWKQGKELLLLHTVDDAVVDDPINPYSISTQTSLAEAFIEGYEGTGIAAGAFDHPTPEPDTGIFVMPDVVTIDDDGSRRARAAMVWSYDEWNDKQDPKVRPVWANFPVRARCILLDNQRAWSGAIRWVTNTEIRGYNMYELPCPPYDFEVEGTQLTSKAVWMKKGGSKSDWKSVLEQMQEEVDNMPEGFYIGDDYLNVTLSASVTSEVSVTATTLLYGHSQMGEDDLWIGTNDEYEEAVVEAANDYDFTDDVEVDGIDLSYVEWDVDNTDTSELSAG